MTLRPNRRLRTMGLAAACGIVALLGLMAVVRLAPVDPADWHMTPGNLVPEAAGWRGWVLYPPGPTDGVRPMPGGAYAAAYLPDAEPTEVLERLAAIAAATPRTRLIAGTPAEGRMTFETRSAVWGFPDYTTAEAVVAPAGSTFEPGPGVTVYVAARLRFGLHDFGVNAARLSDWMSRL